MEAAALEEREPETKREDNGTELFNKATTKTITQRSVGEATFIQSAGRKPEQIQDNTVCDRETITSIGGSLTDS